MNKEDFYPIFNFDKKEKKEKKNIILFYEFEPKFGVIYDQ